MMSKALLTVERYFSHNITTQKVFNKNYRASVSFFLPLSRIRERIFGPAVLAALRENIRNIQNHDNPIRNYGPSIGNLSRNKKKEV